MKLLSFLNVSNISNIEADSGYTFQKILINSLLKTTPNLDVYFVCPKDIPPISVNVTHIPLNDNYLNKYSVRFNFPWNGLMLYAPVLKDIDFAIINQPELVSNFRALFTVLGNTSVKIASYFHYVPIEKPPANRRITYTNNMDHGNLAKVILSRQFESLLTADYCITCSMFGVDFIQSNARTLGNPISKYAKIKLINIPPPVSLSNVIRPIPSARFDIKTFMYNHRLYDHYGTRTLFEWLSELYEKRQDFRVLVTDPTGKRSKERDSLDKSVNELRSWLRDFPFVTVKHIKNHSDYYKVLSKCYAGLAPLNPSALWSMSAVDVMAHGKPLIAPNYACFPEMLKNNNSLIFGGKQDFFRKVNDIIDEEGVYFTTCNCCLNRAKSFSGAKVAKKFQALF